MRLLLEKGADPKLTTKDGNTALMFAAGVGYRDKNTRGSESDALEAVKIFVDAGLDLHQANTRGETALHGAADRGADTIVQFLVDHGAELNVKTKQGFTPLDVAMGKASLGPAAGSQTDDRCPAAKARSARSQGCEVVRAFRPAA